MFARLTFCKFLPERFKEARKIYLEEVVPIIKKQRGNLNVFLLEPSDKSEDYISITQWKTKSDADAYESSGTYKRMVSKLDGFFTKQPVLKTYNADESRVAVRDHL
jgi:heme-degrading monooxygenase HmoA